MRRAVHQWYCGRVARLFFACWLGLFAIQTSDLLILVAGDDCTEAIAGSASDPCPQNCARCFCCVQIAPFLTLVSATVCDEPALPLVMFGPSDAPPNPPPHRILHVPKSFLT